MSPNTATEWNLSEHARRRSQQRSIPPTMLDYLFRFGTSTHCGDGAERIVLTRKGREALARSLGGVGGLRPFENCLDAYAVVADDGSIVTVGHSYRRFRHR